MVKIEVIVAEYMGMCNGVKRAVDIAEGAVRLYGNDGGVYMLGPLVHNPHVIRHFADKGVKIADSLSDIKSGNVIIRAHGVPDRVKKEAAERGLNVIDATCGLVLKAKEAAEMFERDGYKVVVYGKRKHPEIIGIAGNLKNPIIVENPGEVKNIGFYPRIGLISQTTNMPEKYVMVQEELRKHCGDLRAADTICDATQKRQSSAADIAGKVELMLVIGDSSSANSRNLFEVCKEINDETFLIGNKNDFKPSYLSGVKKVGLTASASSPDWIINGVIDALRGI